MDRMGIVLIVLGIALALASGFADTIGLGDDRGFHYRQGIGVGVGVALAVIGVIVGIKRARQAPERDSAASTPGTDSTR